MKIENYFIEIIYCKDNKMIETVKDYNEHFIDYRNSLKNYG